MKLKKSAITSVICSSLLIGSLTTANAVQTTPSYQNVLTKELDLIKSDAALKNSHRWDEDNSLYTSDTASIQKAFLKNTSNEQHQIGFFIIDKAKFVSAKLLSKDISNKVLANYGQLVAMYGSVDVFYVAENLTVKSEDKYHINGINYFLIPVVTENEQNKIAQVSLAPVDILTSMNQGFGTTDEKELASYYTKRKLGQYLNHKGETIASNAATLEQLQQEKGSMSSSNTISPMVTGDHTRPSTISVYLTDPSNQQYYLYPSGNVANVDLYFYCTHVLPFEWVNSFATQALNAGAEAVKMYGWYNVYYPIYTNINADVYDNTNSQTFKAYADISQYGNCTTAINAVGSIATQTSSGNLFLPSYRSGSADGSGYQSGTMSINGTNYLASGGAYSWLGIFQYYYNNSATTNYGTVTTFSY